MEMICIAFAGSLLAACIIAQATAADIRIACYSDANECEVTQDLARRFMQANQDVRITIDRVPFKAILESLRCSSPAGRGRISPVRPTSAPSPDIFSTYARW